MAYFSYIPLQSRLNGKMLKPSGKQLAQLTKLAIDLNISSQPINCDKLSELIKVGLPQLKLRTNMSKRRGANNIIAGAQESFTTTLERFEATPMCLRWEGTILPKLATESLLTPGCEITYIAKLYSRNGKPQKLAIEAYNEPVY